jgi:hypothetical protein
VVRNYEKYSSALGVEKASDFDAVWRGEVATLEDWTMKRVAWLDSKFTEMDITTKSSQSEP